MPEIGQYNFSMREAAVAFIKQSGITAGRWAIGVNFTINIGNFGPDEKNSAPSVMAQVQGFSLVKAPDDAPETPTIIDASKI